MEKGLLFFTLSILCLWLLLDEFFGNRRISKVALTLTPELKIPFFEPMTTDDMRESIEESDNITDSGKDTMNKIIDELEMKDFFDREA